MIKFMPHMGGSLLWSRKCQRTFETEKHLRDFVARKCTLFSHFVGNNNTYTPEDIELRIEREFDLLTGWNNFCTVLLNGIVLGHCGE